MKEKMIRIASLNDVGNLVKAGVTDLKIVSIEGAMVLANGEIQPFILESDHVKQILSSKVRVTDGEELAAVVPKKRRKRRTKAEIEAARQAQEEKPEPEPEPEEKFEEPETETETSDSEFANLSATDEEFEDNDE